jgi:hypothetical protein
MDATYDLALMRGRAVVHSGVAKLRCLHGRTSLQVGLSEDMTRYDEPGGGSVDLPTFISLPMGFEDVAVDVDVCSRLHDDAPPTAVPFAGLAYRLSGRDRRRGRVEVRPLNGTPEAPPNAHTRRAAEFVTSQEWPFDKLSPEASPEGAAPETWTRVSAYIDGTRLVAMVDGEVALVIPVNRAAALRGDLGLFVDVGTEAYFSNLRVTPV